MLASIHPSFPLTSRLELITNDKTMIAILLLRFGWGSIFQVQQWVVTDILQATLAVKISRQFISSVKNLVGINLKSLAQVKI